MQHKFVLCNKKTGNFGVQCCEEYYRTFKIDNEHMFSFEHQDEYQEDMSIEATLSGLGNDEVMSAYLASPHYLEEKQAMLKRIAETDFTIIAAMLRHTVTSTKIPYARETMLSLLAMHDQETTGRNMIN